MSLYQLTIEPGTAYADLHRQRRARGARRGRLPPIFIEMTQELTEKAGLPAYEVSNHARPGHESRHNLLYWRYGEYAGVGPGAHSRLADGENRRALVAEKHPETWRKLVAGDGNGIVEDAVVPPADQAAEYLLMGLRIAEGIDLARYAALAGRAIGDGRIADLESLGLLRRDGARLTATRSGRRVLNALIAELAA